MNNLPDGPTRRNTVVIFLVLLGAAVLALWLIEPRPRGGGVARVSLLQAEPSTETIVISAAGTVRPSVLVELRAEVSGRVVAQHPRLVPGGRFHVGETLVRLDPADYEYAMDRQKAELDKALVELKMERGRKKIAEEEWRRLNMDAKADDEARALALRAPQLKAAESAVEAAKSALSSARLSLDRTAIRAPFDAMVLEEYTDVGQYMSPQSRIATLVGVQSAWIRAAVPVDSLRWIRLPGDPGTEGSTARVLQDIGTGEPAFREGRVIFVEPDLDPEGRMARLLVRVDKPFEAGAIPPLFLGAAVKVEIEGPSVENVYRLPRAALRDGSTVWIMNADDRLDIRPVEVLSAGKSDALVRGLQPGEQVVTGPLAHPVAGMKLRRAEGPPAETQAE